MGTPTDSTDGRTHAMVALTREVVGGEEFFRLTFIGEDGMPRSTNCQAMTDRGTGKDISAYDLAEDKLLKWMRAEMGR